MMRFYENMKERTIRIRFDESQVDLVSETGFYTKFLVRNYDDYDELGFRLSKEGCHLTKNIRSCEVTITAPIVGYCGNGTLMLHSAINITSPVLVLEDNLAALHSYLLGKYRVSFSEQAITQYKGYPHLVDIKTGQRAYLNDHNIGVLKDTVFNLGGYNVNGRWLPEYAKVIKVDEEFALSKVKLPNERLNLFWLYYADLQSHLAGYAQVFGGKGTDAYYGHTYFPEEKVPEDYAYDEHGNVDSSKGILLEIP